MIEALIGLVILCTTEVCAVAEYPTVITVTVCKDTLSVHRTNVYNMAGMKTLVVYNTPCNSA